MSVYKITGRGIKINTILIIVGVAAVLAVAYFLLRDTAEKNLKKARK